MYTRKISNLKDKAAIQYMAFGAGKPVAPYVSRQLVHEKQQGDPSSVRESRYPLPSFFDQRHCPLE